MYAIKLCGEWAFNFILSLTLALKQETCQLHAPAALTTEDRTTTVHGIGYWVYLRSSEDGLEGRKFSFPFRETNDYYWILGDRNYYILKKKELNKRKSEPANHNLSSPSPKLS
jgi:hypothetical protein